MALLTSAPISQLGIELLVRSLVLVRTVARIPSNEYSGPSGGTVTLRVPHPRTARTQAAPGNAITYDAVDESGVDVTVSHHYDATLVSDEELSLELESFGTQVLLPQVASVAQAAEDLLAAEMNGLTASGDAAFAMSPDVDDDRETILAIREQLTLNDVPAGNRYVACAPDITTRLLTIPEFVRAAYRGDGGDALASAVVGEVYGLTFVESNAIDTGVAVAYHSSGFAFGSMPPVAPGGGADSSNAEAGGVALRHILAFDPGHLSTASAVSIFAGASVVTEDGGSTIKRALKVVTDGS